MEKENTENKKSQKNKVSFDKEVNVGFITDSPGIKVEAEFDLMDTPSDSKTRKDNTILRNVILSEIGSPPLAEDGEPRLKRDSNTRKIDGNPVKVDPEKDKELVVGRWGKTEEVNPQEQNSVISSKKKSDSIPSLPPSRRASLDVKGNVEREDKGFADRIKNEKSNDDQSKDGQKRW